jgi:hypothetical protein
MASCAFADADHVIAAADKLRPRQSFFILLFDMDTPLNADRKQRPSSSAKPAGGSNSGAGG